MHTLSHPGSTREVSSSPSSDASPVLQETLAAGRTGGEGFSAEPSIATDFDAEFPPILIADDDEDDVFFLQRLIKRTGVKNRVITFSDGSEIVDYLDGAQLSTPDGRRRCPLLLFLDLKMAGLGGFGFLEWARQQKVLAPLVIVILSNSNAPEDVSRALALGAHRYLVKYPCVQTITTIVRSVYPFTFY